MKKLSFVCIFAAVALAIAIPGPVAARDAGTLVVVQEAEPVGLDLMRSSIQTTMNVAYNIHDTLFHPQEDASVTPAIAESWEQVDDLTWKIKIRKGATFHNGEPINADAVKYSFDRVFNPDIQCPHKGKLSGFKEVKVIDPYTVTISTDAPFAPGLYMLAYYLPIVPPGYIKKVGDAEYNATPIGSGPYRLIKWVRGEEVIMERYDKYYGPKPAYKRLVFKAIPEESSRIAALLTGESDVISGIPVHQRKKIEDSRKAYLTPQMGVMPYLGINTYEAPFDDVRVRQAVNYSINRELINKALFGGKAIICNGPTSPRTFGANPALKPYPFDPKKSRELLKAAGHPNGIKVRLAYGTYMSQIQEQSEAIASDLAKGGIEVTLEPFERAVMWERYKGKKHQLFIYWWDDAPEPHRYIYSLFHSKSRDYYYKNTKIDELLDKGAATMDRGKRALVYNEIDKILYDDCPWAYLYVIPEVFGVANGVSYQGKRDGFLDMRYASPKK
ncbi:MAG: ABC transporter substrate-binding protein [Deltaproteobacteria bacterium]|nr:ABC transporter substrate-binding protein [Deltaproteobacteria bacterium]